MLEGMIGYALWQIRVAFFPAADDDLSGLPPQRSSLNSLYYRW
jgi:hypothetical protein